MHVQPTIAFEHEMIGMKITRAKALDCSRNCWSISYRVTLHIAINVNAMYTNPTSVSNIVNKVVFTTYIANLTLQVGLEAGRCSLGCWYLLP